MRTILGMVAGLGLLGAVADAAETAAMPARIITGTVQVAPEHGDTVQPGDRLVLKIFHPRDGVEMDTTYRIHDEAALPFAFSIGPSVDMNGRVRWPTYQVEVSTDRDGDVLSLGAGELIARSEAPVALGTHGLVLILRPGG